jgi:hypothetical protein
MQFFIPLAKIDEEKRLVIGRAVQETVDRANEILDYASSKANFETWSKTIEEASGGLSKGNLRSMHNPRSASGKIVDIAFDDDARAIDIVAKVVDDQDWKKVVEGVFTGFSVGGGYGRKWKDPETGATRYTAKPSEISLVDLPCIHTARIAELHKADGTLCKVYLRGRPRTFAELAELEKAAPPIGPRTFAQLAKGRR